MKHARRAPRFAGVLRPREPDGVRIGPLPVLREPRSEESSFRRLRDRREVGPIDEPVPPFCDRARLGPSLVSKRRDTQTMTVAHRFDPGSEDRARSQRKQRGESPIGRERAIDRFDDDVEDGVTRRCARRCASRQEKEHWGVETGETHGQISIAQYNASSQLGNAPGGGGPARKR